MRVRGREYPFPVSTNDEAVHVDAGQVSYFPEHAVKGLMLRIVCQCLLQYQLWIIHTRFCLKPHICCAPCGLRGCGFHVTFSSTVTGPPRSAPGVPPRNFASVLTRRAIDASSGSRTIVSIESSKISMGEGARGCEPTRRLRLINNMRRWGTSIELTVLCLGLVVWHAAVLRAGV